MELQISYSFYAEIPQTGNLQADFGDIGQIIRMLCARKGVEIIEAAAMPDHIHLYVSIPPEVLRIRVRRISKRKEQFNDIRQARKSQV